MTPTWHFIAGAEGCAFAVAHNTVAVVVDALRASATAAMLLDGGAADLIVVETVEEALALKQRIPDALLFGERHAVPPQGFDYGNSPRDAHHGRGRRCVFTTTTGAGRLVACWGAARVFMGSPVNGNAVSRAAYAEAVRLNRDITVIPAGLTGNPTFQADEDWAGAAAIAMEQETEVIAGEGAERYASWSERIRTEGLERLFAAAPHAANLVRAGMAADIHYCAGKNRTGAVPVAMERLDMGIRVADFYS